MIEYISNEDEQKRVREEICRRWESFWADSENEQKRVREEFYTRLETFLTDENTTAKDLLCSTILPSILPEEFNRAIKEHGLDLVEVQPMEPPKKL